MEATMVNKRSCSLLVVALLLLVLLSGCRELPREVRQMLTEEQLSKLEDDGLTINEGSDPPNVEGSYYSDSEYCVYSSDGYSDWYAAPYYYRFSNQSGDEVTVEYNSPEAGDAGGPAIGYIAGDGDDFSIFIESTGTNYYGITYTNVTAYSGTITPEGIAVFMFGFIMTKKSDDPVGYLMDVGEDRIFVEDDGMAVRATYPTPLIVGGDRGSGGSSQRRAP
jgi:hypothetical protein